MKQHLYTSNEPSFQKVVIASIVLHLLFITLITVPLKTKKREYKSYFVNIVTPSEIRRTTKTAAVKKKGRAAKKTIKAKPAPRKRVRSKKGVTLEPANRVKNEIERLKAISTLAKLKKKKSDELAKSQEEEEAVADAIEDIRKSKKIITISKRPGIFGSLALTKSDAYSALVEKRITDEWIHSKFDSLPEAIVSFRINMKGEVVNPMIVKSSGNRIFDMSVMKAVKKASPLPPPVVENEYELRFHL